MTVSIETTKVSYSGNGVTTVFSYPFRIFEDNDIQAVVTAEGGAATDLVLNTDYSVTGAGNVAGGTVVLTAGSKCPTGSTLTLLRNMELTQDTDYTDGEAFTAESLETVIDKQMMIAQQEKEKNDRSLKIPHGSTVSVSLPAVVPSGLFAWNAAGSAVEFLLSAPPYISIAVSASSYGADISAAITAIGSSNVTLIVDSPITVNDNAVFHANTNVVVQSPGLFVVASGKTLTGLKESRPEWFGSGTDAVGKAIATGGVVKLQDGVTYTTASITYNGSVKIEGSGTLKHADSQSTPLISSTGAYNHKISGITIDGNQANQSADFATVLITGASSVAMDNVTMVNGNGVSEATTAGRAGVTFVECSNAVVNNSSMSAAKYSALMFKKLNGTVTDTYGNRVSGGSYSSNGGSGVVTFLSNDVEISGVTANSNGAGIANSGISINGPRNKVIGCTAHNNDAAGINVGHGIDTDLNATGSIITGNHTNDNNYGISIVGDNTVIQSNITVTGNQTYSNAAAGIAITQYAKGCTISHNTTKGEVIGIRLAGEQHVVIGNDCGLTNTDSILIAAGATYVGQDMILSNNILEGATNAYVNTSESGGALVKGILNDGYVARVSPNSAHTGTTAETLIFSKPIRSWLVLNGLTRFRVKASGLKTGVANKTIRMEMGAAGSGTGIVNQVVTTTNAWSVDVFVNAVSTNVGHYQVQVYDAGTKSTDTLGTQTFGVNFGDTFFVELFFTLGDAAESITLSSYSIELVR